MPLMPTQAQEPAQTEPQDEQDTGSISTQALQLAPVTVSGQALVGKAAALTTRGATEGSDAYTTDVMETSTPFNLSLRETPQSVSVVTRQRIEDQDLDTIKQVLDHTVGVSVNQYETNRAVFNSRGFKVKRLLIDGVPILWSQAWSAGEIFGSMAIYDHVEIVRGANGLMTGAGNPSAAINLVHKRARSMELTGSVEVSTGSWDSHAAQVDISAPLNASGTIRGRLVGAYSKGDSWIDLYSQQREVLYGTVDIDLSNDTVLWLGISHQHDETDSPMWGGLPAWYADGSRTDWPRSKTTAARWSQWNTTNNNYFVHLQHVFDNGWHARLSYNRADKDSYTRLLYLSGYVGGGLSAFPGSFKTDISQDTISLKFGGPFSFLGRQHQLAFGYVYSHADFIARAYEKSNYKPIISNFEDYQGNYPEPTWGALNVDAQNETTQQGLYAVGRFSLADPLHLIVGARISSYEKTGDSAYGSAYELDPGYQITPYAGVIYDFNDHISGYASYTSIFQPQDKRDVNGHYLDPIVGHSTELGLKGEFMNDQLHAALTLFRIKQDGLGQATEQTVRGTINETAYVATDGATSQGYELQISGALTPRWNIVLGYTHFNVEDAQGDAVNTIYPTDLLRLFTTYQLPGAWSNLTVGGGLSWQGNTYTYARNPAGEMEKIQQDAYALVSLMARYQFNEQLTVQLNVNNLFDEKYFNPISSSGAITYGMPRNVTASVEYNF